MPPDPALRFLADMGIGRRVVRWLEAEGHDATHLAAEGLQRLPDRDVLDKCIGEGRILLTFDLDFGELVGLSRGRPARAIVFRLRNAKPDRVIERLQTVLVDCGPALDSGVIVLVEESRHRIRRLPVGTPTS